MCIIKLLQEYEAIYLAKLTIQMMSPLQLERSLAVPAGTTGQKPHVVCSAACLTRCYEVALVLPKWISSFWEGDGCSWCVSDVQTLVCSMHILFSYVWTSFSVVFSALSCHAGEGPCPSKTLSVLEESRVTGWKQPMFMMWLLPLKLRQLLWSVLLCL